MMCFGLLVDCCRSTPLEYFLLAAVQALRYILHSAVKELPRTPQVCVGVFFFLFIFFFLFFAPYILARKSCVLFIISIRDWTSLEAYRSFILFYHQGDPVSARHLS